MSNVLCITNRGLCRGDFLERISGIAACRPAGIVLREKDLTAAAYAALAREVMRRCRAQGTLCILHSFADVALELGATAIHLPLPLLRELEEGKKSAFTCIGASCHSRGEALEAQELGCTYITAGHVFDTGCKQGLPGRGMAFLQDLVQAVEIPVYAIGGISGQNIGLVRRAGAAGACVMSGAMQCGAVSAYFKDLERGWSA